jgi:uncharacterized protein (TIGR00251 family)
MILTVKVTPNAKHNAIKRFENGILYVAVAAPAEGGKANAELVRYLKTVFGESVKLLTGSTARMKHIGVNLTQEQLESKLGQ